MKKVVVGIMISLVIALQGITVLGANFESIKMKMELPTAYYDLKAGIDNNDSKIAYYEAVLKTTKEELSSQFEQNGILYNGISTNLSKQLILSETENTLTKKIFHLNTATEKQMDQLKEELNELAQAQNMQVSTQDTYEKDGIVYLHTILKNSSLTIYQYYTIVNGKGITISLNSTYTNTRNEELQETVDSIEFSELEEKTPDYTNYIIIGVSVVLVIMVLVLMYMAFFSKKER